MKKILIVDDSIEWINFHINSFNTLFNKNEYKIDTAMSAKEGLLALNKDLDYDLIISDLEMEQVFNENYAGVWFIKEAKQIINPKKSKIIIISGAYNIKQIAEELNVDYIPKPTLINNLITFKYKIDELLQK